MSPIILINYNINFKFRFEIYIIKMEVRYEKRMGTSKFQKQNDCFVYRGHAYCGFGFLFSDYIAL